MQHLIILDTQAFAVCSAPRHVDLGRIVHKGRGRLLDVCWHGGNLAMCRDHVPQRSPGAASDAVGRAHEEVLTYRRGVGGQHGCDCSQPRIATAGIPLRCSEVRCLPCWYDSQASGVQCGACLCKCVCVPVSLFQRWGSVVNPADSPGLLWVCLTGLLWTDGQSHGGFTRECCVGPSGRV